MTLEVGTLHEMVVKNAKKNTVYLIPEIEKVVVFNDDPKCVITFGNESVVFDVDSNVIFLRMNTQWTPNVSLQETMLNDIMILYRKIPTETYLFQEMTFVSATHETFTILMANTHTNLDEMRSDFAFKTIRFAYGEFENVLKSANITIDTTMEFSNMNKKIEYTCIVEYVSNGVIADLFVYNTSQAFKLPDTKEKGAFYILKMFPVTNKDTFPPTDHMQSWMSEHVIIFLSDRIPDSTMIRVAKICSLGIIRERNMYRGTKTFLLDMKRVETIRRGRKIYFWDLHVVSTTRDSITCS